VTEWERWTVNITPRQKRFLKNQDESASEMFRRFIDGWMEDGSPPDGREIRKEQLEKEIREAEDRIEKEQERKQEKKELLERLKDSNSIHPNDEDNVDEFVSKVENVGADGNIPVFLNPHSDLVTQHSTETLSATELVKHAVRKAEETPIDNVVANYRIGEVESFEEARTVGQFNERGTKDIDESLAVELLELRHQELPEDWGGPEIESNFSSIRTEWDLPDGAVNLPDQGQNPS